MHTISAIPAPGPGTMSHPKVPVRLPPGSIPGVKNLSARGPTSIIPIPFDTCAMKRLAPKTRPWTPGSVLDCQMAWLAPLATGMNTEIGDLIRKIKKMTDIPVVVLATGLERHLDRLNQRGKRHDLAI
jgi:hypothetical protein